MGVCGRHTMIINEKTNNVNMKKCDLYSTSSHIFEIYIFTYFVQ